MAYDKKQFRDLIIKVLTKTGFQATENVVSLLLGTAAVESSFGTHLRQLKGPARGAFQVEGETFNWLKKKYPKYIGADREADDLEWDLWLSIVVCRLKYLSCPGAIPSSLEGQAQYWKKWYNTPLGKGTVDDYLSAYYKYVA